MTRARHPLVPAFALACAFALVPALAACDGGGSSSTDAPFADAGTAGGDDAGAGAEGGGSSDVDAALPTGRFTIGMWCGPPPGQLTKARFDEVAAAGITTVSPSCESGSDTVTYDQQVLALANGSGLDALVADTRIAAALAGTDVDANLDAVTHDWANAPGLAGYHVRDEPSEPAFPALARVVNGLASRDPSHVAYVNLLPNYASPDQLGAPSYDAYVGDYLAAVKPKLLSWDYYPFLTGSADAGGFFADMAVVRAHALAAKLPFWQFVQSISFNGHRATTKAEKLWVGTETLAYGGAGVSYFTYWTPPQTAENFGVGIIGSDGAPTAQYAEIRDNDARLSAFGRYLVAATSTAVFHGGALADGAVPREPGMPLYVPSAAPVTVGLFAVPDASHDVYAFVANRDYDSRVEIDAVLAPTAAAPQILDVPSGTFVPLPIVAKDAGGTRVHLAIDPADGALVRLVGPVPPGPLGAEAYVGVVRGDAGTLDVVDSAFGTASVRAAGWNDCPAGFTFIGRDFESNGFWLCARGDLAGRTFLVGNVVADAGTLYSVKGGTATPLGSAGWNSCPGATYLARRFESNGYWVCL